MIISTILHGRDLPKQLIPRSQKEDFGQNNERDEGWAWADLTMIKPPLRRAEHWTANVGEASDVSLFVHNYEGSWWGIQEELNRIWDLHFLHLTGHCWAFNPWVLGKSSRFRWRVFNCSLSTFVWLSAANIEQHWATKHCARITQVNIVQGKVASNWEVLSNWWVNSNMVVFVSLYSLVALKWCLYLSFVIGCILKTLPLSERY